jgi:hypothetical protein
MYDRAPCSTDDLIRRRPDGNVEANGSDAGDSIRIRCTHPLSDLPFSDHGSEWLGHGHASLQGLAMCNHEAIVRGA